MKKIVFVLLFIFSIVILIVGFIIISKPDKLTEEERQKAIDQVAGGKANLDPEIKTGNGVYEGKLIKFSYPAAAVIYDYKSSSLENNTNQSESFSFDLKSPRLVLNYTAEETLDTKIEDITAIKFRLDKSNGYESKTEKIVGIAGLSFKKDRTGGYLAEKTLFFINNGHFFTFSITGSSLDDVEKLHKQIVDSITFK